MVRRGPGKVWTLVAALVLHAATAHAQSAEQLEEARKTFGEGVEAEKNGGFEVACERFALVQRVRDTVNVRYRLGTCFEGLGRVASALVSYEAAIQLGEPDPGSAEVVAESKRRITFLSKRVPRILLTLSKDASPADTEIRVDDAVLPAAGLSGAIPVDPGPHTVSVRVGGFERLRTTVDLSKGEQTAMAVPEAPAPTITPVVEAPPRRKEVPRGVSNAPSTTPQRLPWVASAAGGAVFTAASIVFLALRDRDVTTLERRCPAGKCPPGENRDELDTIRARVDLEGSFAIGLGLTGIAALGVGAYMLLKPDPPRSTTHGIRIIPMVSQTGGSCSLGGEF